MSQECILKTLVDISPEARLARFVSYKRPSSETIILFLARRIAERSMMEGPHVPKDRRITLPESVYLNFTVGQMSDRRDPRIRDSMLWGMTSEEAWTLAKVKEQVDKAPKPIRFQGCKTAITKMIDLHSQFSLNLVNRRR